MTDDKDILPNLDKIMLNHKFSDMIGHTEVYMKAAQEVVMNDDTKSEETAGILLEVLECEQFLQKIHKLRGVTYIGRTSRFPTTH